MDWQIWTTGKGTVQQKINIIHFSIKKILFQKLETFKYIFVIVWIKIYIIKLK
jgi:hypothetical protein